MKKLSCAGHIHPLLALFFVMALAAPLGFYGTYLYLAPSLPDIEQLKSASVEMPMQVYTRDGVLAGEFGERLSQPVRYQDIPKSMIHAFLAAEDASFFTHSGVSVKGLGRAVTEALQSGSTQSGGSTITMQVAKNYYLSPERTLKRKLTEVFLARKIEQTLTKPEILTLYVNKIFLGQHAYGIRAAARVYYNKELNQLTIAEMAMIAGLPKAPSKYNPVVNPKRALERRNWIIGRMLQLGYINQEQYQKQVAEPINLNMVKGSTKNSIPYLAEMVRVEMVEKFGAEVINSGWKIYTTVDSKRQQMADNAVKKGLEEYDRRHGWRGAEANNKPLEDFKVVGQLVPARVTKIQARQIEAVLADGQTIKIDWSGMAWARKYRNANSVGGYPSNASQIVQLNDIIRVRQKNKTEPVADKDPNKEPKNTQAVDTKPENQHWVLDQIPKVQGQLVALNPQNGALEAIVGGYDFAGSKFNRSIQGWRQPGSTIKPFVYALALERGFTPYSTVQDSPLQVGKWRPQNSDARFMGAITLRRALYLSRNLVSIRLLQTVGIERARDYISHFGLLKNEMPRNLTLALGTAQVVPLQIATGYAAFANGGYRIQPYFIAQIKDNYDRVLFSANPIQVCPKCGTDPTDDASQASDATTNDGQSTPLIQPVEANADGSAVDPTLTTDASTSATADGAPADLAQPTAPIRAAERIMKASAAYDMANILRDVVQHGTAIAAMKLGRNDIGGKTGTTNDAKDAWFSGFHPSLVAVAWVGFDNPSTLGRREYGGIAALPIWTKFMAEALADTPSAWVTRQGTSQKISANRSKTPDDLAKQAALDEKRSRAEARAKAPPVAVYIQRPKPPAPPAEAKSSIDPSLPVVRLSPNVAQSGRYSSAESSPD